MKELPIHSAKMFRDNIEGTRDFFATYIYPGPALQPEFHWLNVNSSDEMPIEAPEIRFIRGGRLFVNLNNMTESRSINQIAIYKLTEGEWSVFMVLAVDGAATNKNVGLEIESGSYVATLVDRFGREGLKKYFSL